MIIHSKTTLSIFYLIYTIGFARSKFVKFGPCMIPWKTECPDPFINFYLFTTDNKNGYEKVEANKESLLNSSFNPLYDNKIIIHGYNSDMNLTQLLNMKDGYLTVGNYNVWMVDWSTVAVGPCYPVVVASLSYVGTCISQLVKAIRELIIEPPKNLFHVIGFSMGAHVAAHVANSVKPYKLSRITGLDPALPLFTSFDPNKKLDKSDAEFVDVLHTDSMVEGKASRSGHIDFYMNGGLEQPGCWHKSLIESFRCNHHRAPTYFAESITSKVGFWGWPCKGFFHYLTGRCPPEKPTLLMGEYCDKNSTGYYIIHTSDEAPFAIGQNYTVITNNTISVNRNNETRLITYKMKGAIEKYKSRALRLDELL